MKRLSLMTLIFAILSLVFIILLVFLRFKFPPYPLVSYQDAFDVLTPLVLIPFYWLMFRSSVSDGTTLVEETAFIVLAAIWVEGHGMHLSANSVDNLIDALAHNPATNLKGTDVYQLVYFFDERLGHYVWHVGMLGLIALLIYHEWHRPAALATTWWMATVAGIIYGFSYFAIFIEGQTVILGFPVAIVVVLFALVPQRKQLAQRPVLAFFCAACLVAVVLFTVWGLYWRGFPQFSDVGLI